MLWLRVDFDEFKREEGQFLLDLTVILRTVVLIKSVDRVDDINSNVNQRKRRSVFRFKRDSDSTTGYVHEQRVFSFVVLNNSGC